MLLKIRNNPALIYIITRYGTYLIQFINSLLIAAYLGPIYLAYWGFVNLIIQYFAQINFGVSQSVNTIISINKQKDKYSSNIIGGGIVLIIMLSLLVGLFFFLNEVLEWKIGEKYSFSSFVLPVIFLVICSNFNVLFINVFRVYGRLFEIALSQSLFPLLTLFFLTISKGETLLNNLIWGYSVSTIIALVVFFMRSPVKLIPHFDREVLIFIQKKGLFLFLYNASFYLIMITTRTFVSKYFTPQEFGIFTFSFTLSSIFVLLLESFSFLIWPKLINRLAALNGDEAYELMNKVRNIYITSSHLLVYIGLIVMPYFLNVMSDYRSSFYSFVILAMTSVLYTNSFGYQGLMVAKGQEKRLGLIAFGAFSLNLIFCYILTNFIKVEFSYIAISTLITYLFYILILGICGSRILGSNVRFIELINDLFPIDVILPMFLSIIFVVLKVNFYYFIIPSLLFIVLNRNKILDLVRMIKQIIKNPRVFDF